MCELLLSGSELSFENFALLNSRKVKGSSKVRNVWWRPGVLRFMGLQRVGHD